MASLSMPAALPGSIPFLPTHDLAVSSKPIHTRRTSRNPKLAPLPAFSFNPGATDQNEESETSPKDSVSNLKDGTDESTHKRASPLPDFSFSPGAAIQANEESPSPTHPILEEMALNSSRKAAKAAPLPAFSFNPTSFEGQRTPSPTKSHFAPEAPGSARSTGHRRGTSEYIGVKEGAQSSATTGLGSSPPKTTLTPPPTIRGPPRFSHQHRRSQAVSITEVDTSELIKAHAIAKHRSGSVPSSPTILSSQDHFARASQSISSLYDRTPPTSPARRASACGARPRVGFSDIVDVIPRPLSMISSETEGSTSTVRGCHSLTGSITSLGSPPARSTPSPTYEEASPTPRPRTADAASPSSLASIRSAYSPDPTGITKRPLSASDSNGFFEAAGSSANKRRFWFGSTETSPRTTPRPTPTAERIDPITTVPAFTPASPSSAVQSRPKTSPERKASLKKRKVRTLAGAIFSRKARSRGSLNRGRRTRTPTPPLSRTLSRDITDSVFDDDGTVVIRKSQSSSRRSLQEPTLDADNLITGPSSAYADDPESFVTSPVIDLDAALGPFGSEEKLPQSGFAAARGRMHSSMGRGATDIFGNVHRRAESAPQMPPVNRAGFSNHSTGSNSNVAEDVFDEGEEDDFLAEESKSGSEPEDDAVSDGVSQQTEILVAPEVSHLRIRDSRASSRAPIGLAITTRVADDIEIVDSEDFDREAARSSDSTLTAPTVSEGDIKHQVPSTMAFAYPAPQTTYASSGEGRSAPSSAISSPDAEHLNFEGYPRFNRPASERSPDTGLRASTEDVPSLCDSVSTGNAARFSAGATSRFSTDQRSGSFSAPSTTRSTKAPQAWKRASLASLNKLIPNASGSKSRLRFEESVPREEPEKTKKKANRLSKMMNFWRPKEKESK